MNLEEADGCALENSYIASHGKSIMVTDPVCRMKVDAETAKSKSEYGGATYFFCNAGCKKAFDAEPERFVKRQ